MDRTTTVDELLDRCKSLLEHVLGDPGLLSPSAASLAISEKFRDVGREVLPAWASDRFSLLSLDHPAGCGCGAPRVEFAHRRSTTVQSIFGSVALPYRTFRCNDCGLHLRPDDAPMGIPAAGSFLDDVRSLFEPLAAELPHRTAATCSAGSPASSFPPGAGRGSSTASPRISGSGGTSGRRRTRSR